jgi:hypothetical protein
LFTSSTTFFFGYSALQNNRNLGRRIASDLEIKLRGFERQRGEGVLQAWPEARVLTSTIDSITGKLAQMWRVHYVAEALVDVPTQEHQLSELSSPAEARLPEADYVFWATKAADATNSVLKKNRFAPA